MIFASFCISKMDVPCLILPPHTLIAKKKKKKKSASVSRSVVLTLCDPMEPPCDPHVTTRLLCLWTSPGKNTGVGTHFLLQGIFPIQGSNPGLLHCRWILYHLSHQGSPRILEWVAYPSPGDLTKPGIETGSNALQADSLPAELQGYTVQHKE